MPQVCGGLLQSRWPRVSTSRPTGHTHSSPPRSTFTVCLHIRAPRMHACSISYRGIARASCVSCGLTVSRACDPPLFEMAWPYRMPPHICIFPASGTACHNVTKGENLPGNTSAATWVCGVHDIHVCVGVGAVCKSTAVAAAAVLVIASGTSVRWWCCLLTAGTVVTCRFYF